MRHCSKIFLLFLALLVPASPIAAQSLSNQPVRGPFWSGTIRAPKSNAAIAMKGIAVTLGPEKNAFVCYDTDLLRLSMAWTGEFMEFGNTLAQIAWPPPPQVKGTPVFATATGPGWSKAGSFLD